MHCLITTAIGWNFYILRRQRLQKNWIPDCFYDKYLLNFACPGQVLVCSFNDLVSRWLVIQSYLPRRRTYLSCRTRWHFFQALSELATQCIWQTLSCKMNPGVHLSFSCYKRLDMMLAISLVFIGGIMSLTRLQKALWYRKMM